MTDFQFRLWAYLITYADDYGRGSADPEILKGFVFPRRKRVTESDIAKALADLAGMGCILLYQVDGESYFCFPNWSKHQRVQQKRSKFPEPVENSPCSTVSHGEPPPVSESVSVSVSESNPNPKLCGKREQHPTVDEVAAYCQERGNHVDAGRFVDYYEANGWRIGKNPMKDWKAAVRTWERNERSQHGTEHQVPGRDTPRYGTVV